MNFAMKNKADITIRKAESRDIHEIFEIEKRSFSVPWSEKYISEFMSREFNICFAAFSAPGNTVAGYICICLLEDEAEIENVAVAEQLRGAGIASSLLEHIIQFTAEHGIKKLMLEVRESNIPALNLYKKFGFYEVGIRKNYYTNPKENALLMDKVIHCSSEKVDL